MKYKNIITINSPYIVAVGRLVKQKNYINLIEAFNRLVETKKVNNLTLVIVGEGKEKDSIIQRINHLKLNNWIQLVGFVKNPFPLIKNSVGVVLSSDWEGLPTILIEALSLKKQIISTDCQSGPREILDDGKYGLLVPVNDPVKLAEGISQILTGEVKFDKDSLLERAKYFSVQKSFNDFMETIN
jgi:glycosyltransferase involved in cell wall biosynthesis